MSARQRGFTYVAMLFALVIFGLGLAAIGESWSAASRRDKEEELIQIGSAFASAIGSYYEHSPTTPKAFPVRLDDLVEDKRFIGTMRHLRRLYRDPLTGSTAWGMVRNADGGITGIYSVSDALALRQQPLPMPNGAVVSGTRYSEWQFVYKVKQ
ncbi:MAG: type II secretion system protein [Pseudomonadota bacterium]